MEIQLPSYVSTLMQQLQKNGYECYVVGGAIRCALLHLPIHDYDLTTDALPEEMKKVFRGFHTIDTGLKHGTLTVMSDHQPVEITTYRKDSDYSDHRHPDGVTFSKTVMEDCARRDFTINALCYNEEEGILDIFHGLEDLKNKILRCIGDPYQRFNEDALRILRALRFATRLDFAIEPKTGKAVFDLKETLNYVSRERIHEELEGFLKAAHCAVFLQEYKSVFEVFLPWAKEASDAEWKLASERIESAPADPFLRMAILLSSPSCNPKETLEDLKYSTNEKNRILNLIQCQAMPVNDRIAIKKVLNKINNPFQTYLSYKKSLYPDTDEKKAMEIYGTILENNDCFSLKTLAINGNDMKQLGFQGKEISENLQWILLQVIEEKLPNDREVLLKALSDRQSGDPSL